MPSSEEDSNWNFQTDFWQARRFPAPKLSRRRSEGLRICNANSAGLVPKSRAKDGPGAACVFGKANWKFLKSLACFGAKKAPQEDHLEAIDSWEMTELQTQQNMHVRVECRQLEPKCQSAGFPGTERFSRFSRSGGAAGRRGAGVPLHAEPHPGLLGQARAPAPQPRKPCRADRLSLAWMRGGLRLMRTACLFCLKAGGVVACCSKPETLGFGQQWLSRVGVGVVLGSFGVQTSPFEKADHEMLCL